jgi:hypothetical protein
MAKALVGYMNTPSHSTHLLAAENNRLRARVQELQELVLQLKQENDGLVAQAADHVETSMQQEMQPV